MKITKRQLKRIIKEEKEKLLSEQGRMQTLLPSQELDAELITLEGLIGDFSGNVNRWFDRNNHHLEPTGLLDDPESWAIRLEELRYDLNALAAEIMGGKRRIR